MNHNLIKNTRKTWHSFVNILPIVFGMLLLTSLAVTLLPEQISAELFGKNNYIDAVLGATFGSIAIGHPIASYVLAGELLSSGATMFAVTSLIVSWVTVGFVQLPAEALMLGNRFAIYRNLMCFLFAVTISILMTYTLELIG